MWQAKFEKYRSEGFTIVGLALDAEGVEPAKRYYDQFDVTFPALVDPNYATGFGAVPKTFFIDEHGVVMDGRQWESRLAKLPAVKPVTDSIRAQWTPANGRLDAKALASLVAANQKAPSDLGIAAELGSRYLSLDLHAEAHGVLERATQGIDPREIAQQGGDASRQLGHVYLQLARASSLDRPQQIRWATLSYYLNPSVGFGKQIARIIAPEKFDGRPRGDFDNRFREATLSRLRKERADWIKKTD